jgi:peroxiredoxin
VSDGHAKRISYLIGPDGRIRRAYATVKPAEHPAEVLRDLRAL